MSISQEILARNVAIIVCHATLDLINVIYALMGQNYQMEYVFASTVNTLMKILESVLIVTSPAQHVKVQTNAARVAKVPFLETRYASNVLPTNMSKTIPALIVALTANLAKMDQIYALPVVMTQFWRMALARVKMVSTETRMRRLVYLVEKLALHVRILLNAAPVRTGFRLVIQSA